MIKERVVRIVKLLAAVLVLIFLINIMDNFSWKWFFVICGIVMMALLLVPEFFGLEWKGRGSKYDKGDNDAKS